MFTIRSLKKEAQQQLKGHGWTIVQLNILVLIFGLITSLNFILSPLMFCVFSFFYLSLSRYETPSNKRCLFTYPGIQKAFLLSFLTNLLFQCSNFINLFFQKQLLFGSNLYISVIISTLMNIVLLFLLTPYRQTINILIDQPGYGIIEALEESKEMMRGNKKRLLLLDFSYGIWIAIIYFCIYYFYHYIAEHFLFDLYSLIRDSNSDLNFRQALYALFVMLGPIGIKILISLFQFLFLLWFLPRYLTAHANLYNEINDYTHTQYTETSPTSQSSNDSIGKINFFE